MQDLYIIRPDGQLCHAALREVSNGADILRALARSEPVVFSNFPEQGYRFKAQPGKVVLARRLDRIKLNTWFAPITLPDGTARITPVFYDNGMAIRQNLEFTPPQGHEFWFLCPFAINSNTGLHGMSDAPHMAWRIVGDNIYRPPFSNTYDDGKICMGRNWALPTEGSLVAQFEAAEDWFQSAESNSDLRPHTAPIPLLLWDPTDMRIDYRGWDDIDTSVLSSLSGWIYDSIL
jgi:hypothetical protein